MKLKALVPESGRKPEAPMLVLPKVKFVVEAVDAEGKKVKRLRIKKHSEQKQRGSQQERSPADSDKGL